MKKPPSYVVIFYCRKMSVNFYAWQNTFQSLSLLTHFILWMSVQTFYFFV